MTYLWTVAVVAVPLLWKLLGRAVYEMAVTRTTVLRDLARLGERRDGPKLSGKAVIAGGSMAGLLAARVLSDHFEEVVVVEPDNELNERRTRVPQWDQPHIFLAIWARIARRLFHDFDKEVDAEGLSIRSCASGLLQMEGRSVLPSADNLKLTTVSGSRIAVEKLVRRLVLQRCGNVQVMQGTVTGIKPSSDGTRIDFATIRPFTPAAGADDLLLPTAFFVDCSGPAKAGTKWLARAGWETPEEESYNPQVHYASLIVKVPEGVGETLPLPKPWSHYGWIRALFSPFGVDRPTAYGLYRLEGDRLLLSSGQYACPELRPDSFDSFISLWEAYDVANSTEGKQGIQPYLDTVRTMQGVHAAAEPPVDRDWSTCTSGPMHVVHYERLARLPENFAATGDALIKLNPVFGQGCSKSAMDAATLDGLLRTAVTEVTAGKYVLKTGFTREMFKRQMLRVKPMYDSSRWMDYGYTSTKPATNETLSTGRWYRTFFKALVCICHDDSTVGGTFWEVTQQIEPGVLLFQPLVLIRVAMKVLKMGFSP